MAVVDRLSKRLSTMTGYQCSFQMTHLLPDGMEATFLVDQWVEGNRYRVEIYDATGELQQTLVCDGQTLMVRHAPQGLSYAITDGQGNRLGQDLLAGRLLASLTSDSGSLKPILTTCRGKSAWLIDLPPGRLRPDYDIGQRLWLDARELDPGELELYTLSGAVVTRLVFTQFLRNPVIAPERFIASTPTVGRSLETVRIGQSDLAGLEELPFRLYRPQRLPAGAYLNLVTVVEEEGDPVVVQNYVWKDCALCLVERPVHNLVDLSFGQDVELADGRRARLLQTGQVYTLWWRMGDVELMLSGCMSPDDLTFFAKSIY